MIDTSKCIIATDKTGWKYQSKSVFQYAIWNSEKDKYLGCFFATEARQEDGKVRFFLGDEITGSIENSELI